MSQGYNDVAVVLVVSSPVILNEGISSIVPTLSSLVQCSSFKIHLHTAETSTQ